MEPSTELTKLKGIRILEKQKLSKALRNKDKAEILNIKATISMLDKRIAVLKLTEEKNIRESIEVLKELKYHLKNFEEIESKPRDVRAVDVALRYLSKLVI